MIEEDQVYHPRPFARRSGRGGKRGFLTELVHRPGQPITEQELERFGVYVEFDRPAKDGESLDWLQLGSDHIVSERFVAAVEKVDPGRHQFIEVSLLDREDVLGSRATMKFFYPNCTTYLDCIDKERSKLINCYADNPRMKPSWTTISGFPLIARTGFAPTSHFFFDLNWLKRRFFVSPDLHGRLEELGIKPFIYRPVAQA
ncbi:MAG: hypothetical protein K2Y05_04225 [Hyphomicrobiaceae bacterium]|nr:hypothetical protein [Hyphomicrobiaceae bacterium]